MADVVAAPYNGVSSTQIENLGFTSQTSRMNDMGKDAFLKLLTTQLSYQDPMNPMSNEDFISQMAQLQSLEQMMSLTKSFETMKRNQELGAASSLIGCTVNGIIPAYGGAESENVTGLVSGVRMVDGEIKLLVNNKELGLDDILEVTYAIPGGDVDPLDPGSATNGGSTVGDLFAP